MAITTTTTTTKILYLPIIITLLHFTYDKIKIKVMALKNNLKAKDRNHQGQIHLVVRVGDSNPSLPYSNPPL